MKRRFKITDEHGEDFTVEEDTVESNENPVEEDVTVEDEGELTPDEISALKQLAAAAPSILALVNDEADITDEDEVNEDDKDDEEEVVETKDSKSSFGKLEKQTKTRDSFIDEQTNINDAWAKRYGGGR